MTDDLAFARGPCGIPGVKGMCYTECLALYECVAAESSNDGGRLSRKHRAEPKFQAHFLDRINTVPDKNVRSGTSILV